jgi:dUTP pyrophosphatase
MESAATMIEPVIRWVRSWFSPNPVFELVHEMATLPSRGSKESAGLDLYAVEAVTIPKEATIIVKTGLKGKFNPGWAACLWDRSGLGAKGLHRYAGLIDSDYRGEWGVVIHNSSGLPLEIKPYDRIAQVVFQRVWIGQPRLGWVTVDTERGTGGFGSTGK